MRKYLRLFIIYFSLPCHIILPNQDGLVTIPDTCFEIVDSKTGIKVTVSVSAFVIAKTEVTQKMFSDVMHYNPSLHKGEDKPVENVSWWQAIRYCNLRSTKEGLQPCYDLSTGKCDFTKAGYRLEQRVSFFDETGLQK